MLARVLSFAFLWLLFGFRLEPAFAHGDQGDAARPEGGTSVVSIEGYRVELLIAPRPLRAGEENKIIAKILRSGTLEPVRDGKVLIGVEKHASSHSSHSSGRPSLSLVQEMAQAGGYALVRRLDQDGPHVVRVALLELEGRSFDPPAVLEFHLDVAPASGLTPGRVLVWLAALTASLASVYWVAMRSRSSPDFKLPSNLLEIGWLDRFVRWKGFQPSLQIPVLGLTVLITLLGLFDVSDGAKNLATKLTWIIWWPGIIFTFILVGRLWCVMCPFGTLNEWSSSLAQPNRMFPRALRNLWLATLLFVILTWADEQLGIIRSPQMTAWLIIFLAVAAITTGVFFPRRSFCRYLCPITGLQGLYSMVSPVELRVEERSRCLKDCRQDCYRGNEKGAGCPMFEFPMTMERNAYCNFCFECVKACPSGNLALRFRALGKDLWASPRHWLDESYLSLALVGITTLVTAQMLPAWRGWVSALSRLIPLPSRTLLKPDAVTESLIFLAGSLLFFPLFGVLASWIANRLAGKQGRGAKKTFVALGYMFVPVGLAMHLAHNLSHLLVEGPGVIPALQRTLGKYTLFNLGDPDWHVSPLLSSGAIYGLEMALVLGGFVFSLVVGYRLARTLFGGHEVAGKAFVPFFLLALLFTLLNVCLLNQPMGMRHSM